MTQVVSTVRLWSGVVSPANYYDRLSFAGLFVALGRDWEAECVFDPMTDFITFGIRLDPLQIARITGTEAYTEANIYEATIEVFGRNSPLVAVKSTAVQFSGASGGCFFVNMMTRKDFCRVRGTAFEPFITNISEHFVDIRVTLGTVIPTPPPPTPRRQAIRRMFENGERSDVVIEAGGEKFSVHSVIIAHQSDVFNKMLTTAWKEGREGRIVVEDVDKETMRLLLKYMYSYDIPTDLSVQLLLQLFLAADKYNVIGLIEVSNRLLAKQRWTPVAEEDYQALLRIYVFANSIANLTLQETVAHIIKRCGPKMRRSVPFREFLCQYPGEAKIIQSLF